MSNKTVDTVNLKHQWDVIIIGTGMGGAVIGYSLAKAGIKVLFCEKGKSYSKKTAIRGDYAENFFPHPEVPGEMHRDILLRAGRWTDEIMDVSARKVRRFIPFIGSGTGGSSAIYGMALERFFPDDFRPRGNYSDATESTIPEKWPITYEILQPYYESAERLFRVHGNADPLRGNEKLDHLLPPPPLSAGADELFHFFRDKGLHAYRLPMACDYVSDCECCQGYLCDKDCKNDSARICLEPALSRFGAQLIDECEVLRLESTQNRVTGVVCFCRGRFLTLRAPVIVLAAGALETPRILLHSATSTWPNGLANESGLVGRNLMRHYVDLYAVKPTTRTALSPGLKELAFNDFYMNAGRKYGTVQSFGSLPPASVLTAGIEQELREGPIPGIGSLFRFMKPFARFFLTRLLTRRFILATIMEDLPYRDNFISLSDDTDTLGRKRTALNYQIRNYERARINAFRQEIKKILRPYRFMLIKQAENNERIAHASGTCRFGLDPKESVLDANNRAHGLSNLYVVDSSFFPSSGGTNPGLTIAANALRVADHILDIRNKR
jgi:choline dehydrogenase-like flavoprotein